MGEFFRTIIKNIFHSRKWALHRLKCLKKRYSVKCGACRLPVEGSGGGGNKCVSVVCSRYASGCPLRVYPLNNERFMFSARNHPHLICCYPCVVLKYLFKIHKFLIFIHTSTSMLKIFAFTHS